MSQPVQDNANIIIDNLNAVINPTTTTISPTASPSPSPSLAKSADQAVIDQLNSLILPPEPLHGCRIIGNITFTLNGKLIVIKSAEFCIGAFQGKRLIHDGVTEDGKQTAIVSNKDKYVPTTNGSTTNGSTNNVPTTNGTTNNGTTTSVPTNNGTTTKLSQSQTNATTQQILEKSIQDLEFKKTKTSNPQTIKEITAKIINIQNQIIKQNDELKNNPKNVMFANQGDSSSILNTPSGAAINSAKSSSYNLVGEMKITDIASSDNSDESDNSHNLVGEMKITDIASSDNSDASDNSQNLAGEMKSHDIA